MISSRSLCQLEFKTRSLCQLEFKSKDVSKTLIFFEQVFGWKTLPITLQDYFVIDVPEDSSFGISVSPSSQDEGTESPTIAYFRCDQPLDEILNHIKNFGGRVIEGPRSVPAYGKAIKLSEPGGITIGLFFPHAESMLSKVEGEAN